MRDIKEIAAAARMHAANLAADIQNASTRIEHIRLTQLALEAQQLADDIEQLATVGT